MNEDWGKQIAGFIVVVVICVMSYNIMPLSIFVPQLLVMIPVLLAFLCAYAGWPMAAIGGLGAVVGAFSGADVTIAGAVLTGLVLPAGVQYYTYEKRMPFEKSIAINMLALGVLAVAGLALVRIVKGDIAQFKADYVQQWWDSQVNLDLFGGGMNQTLQGRNLILNLFAAQGYFSGRLLSDLQTSTTADVYTRAIQYVVYTLRSVTAYTAAGNLASSVIYGGVLMTAWPRMIASRRWVTPDVPFVPLQKWYMKRETAAYACGLYILTTVMMLFMPEWWYSVDYAIKQCVMVIMTIQGVAVLERQFKQMHVRRGVRGALMLALTVFMRSLVTFAGLASALFGSHGAISNFIQSRMKNGDDDE